MAVLIKDFNDGDEFIGFFLIREIEAKQTNSTKDYLDIVLADSSGQIPAKYWDATKADIETFSSMCLVKVHGLVQLYREKLQAKVIRIRKATDQDEVSVTDFIRSAPVDVDILLSTITNAINSLTSNDIRSVVNYCFEKVKEEIKTSPAAKSHHHAYYGGL